MSLEDRLYPLLSWYEKLPHSLQWLAGATYRRLPIAWRLGKNYELFSRLVEEGESWPVEQCLEYQEIQLRNVLRHAGAHCPFYRQRFCTADFDPETSDWRQQFEQLPFLEKQDLLDHREAIVSSAIPARERLYITTGGSTGVPVGFYLYKGVSRPKEQAFLEAMWRRGGYFNGARLAVIRGHVTDSYSRGKIVSYDATRDWLMLSSYHLTEERFPEYREALKRFRPDMLHAYPSAALQLAEHVEKSGQAFPVALRGLLCGSERLTLPQKRLLERVFDCSVYRWYGHAERVVLAGEGRRSEWFYFWPQYGWVEFGPPDEEGLREIIGTSFHNLAMPLIRYRTGDRVRLVEAGDNEKEFPWPAATEVAGRVQEYLVSNTGRQISLTAFNMHDATFDDLYAVQFYQETPGAVEFRYVAGPAFHQSRLKKIEAGIRRKLGEDFQVVFREVKETEKTSRGKHRWLVSRLTADDQNAAEG